MAGLLPLSVALSQRQLRFIAHLGTGILVGTSLIVIIPEGIETMYSAGGHGRAHAGHAARVRSLSARLPRPDTQPVMGPGAAAVSGQDAALPPRSIVVGRAVDDGADALPNGGPDTHGTGDDDSTEGLSDSHGRVQRPGDADSAGDEDAGHGEGRDPHAYVGVSLVLGFVLMYLVDVVPDAFAGPAPSYQPMHISLSNLARGPHNSSSLSLNAPEHSSPPSRPSSTTIGLVIHSCADGIALGASTTATSTSLSLLIFLAIMLHKAPAAFGLTSVLLKQGFSKRTTRAHLVLFSLAAPAGALATWTAVHVLGRARLGGDDGLAWATGCVLLFSAGTFLYVAMHTMNSDGSMSGGHGDEHSTNGYADAAYGRGHGHAKQRLTKTDVVTAVAGMLVPLVTQVGHVH